VDGPGSGVSGNGHGVQGIVPLVRRSEIIVVAYFVYLGIVAWVRGLSAARAGLVSVSAAVMCALVAVVAWMDDATSRAWAPAVYIVAAYFLTGLMFDEPMPRMEAWLREWDRRLIGDPAARFAGWPAPLLVFLDLVYIFCFLLVPAGFATLVITGHTTMADRYWTLVTAAELGAFALLPFVQTRPPWALEEAGPSGNRILAPVASLFVRHATIRANTFPSGHAAGSLAVALGVGAASPAAGAALGVVALCIALACVVGRYHYAVDVLAGLLMAVAFGFIVSTVRW